MPRLTRVVAAAVLVGVAVALALGPRAGTALVVSEPLPAPDAIVSLASHEWERLPATATLARQWSRALVVLTLPEHVNGFNCHDCSHRTQFLEQSGISSTRVRIVPLREGGTYGEALAVGRLASREGFRRVLVVTSPYHTRRALVTFVSVLGPEGITVGIEPATKTSPAQPENWWMAPYDRAYVRYEWAALAYYAIRFGIRWR